MADGNEKQSEKTDEIAGSCSLCQNEDTDEMIQCDKCDQWYHFTCAGVDSNVAFIDWCCEKCKAPQEQTPRTRIGRPPKYMKQEKILHDSSIGVTTNQIAARNSVPKDLPSFSGRPEEWPIFISAFENSTATCGYSNVENLLRLQKCLRGKALEMVRSQLLLPALVPEIIKTLRMLFGRPELIIRNLIQQIRNQPAPKQERLESVISYALVIKNLSSTIEACGLKAHNNNPLLLDEIVEKLPGSMKLNWAMHSLSLDEKNISSFSEWLFTIATAASTVTTNICAIEKVERRREGVLHTHQAKTIEEDSVCCPQCQNRHKLHHCDEFKKLERAEKWQRIKELKLCKCCLERHHFLKCNRATPCNINGCQSKHHPTLHAPKFQKNSVTSAIACHNVSNEKQSSVLLRIVPVIVRGKERSIKTYALLDEGSSLTLIEENLAQSLNLEGEKQTLCLRWTGNHTREESDSRKVSLSISSRNDNTLWYGLKDVRTVKDLRLPEQTIKIADVTKTYSYLKGLPLSSYDRAVPRILIGIDNWKLGIPLRIVDGKWNEPVATKTRLGWTIQGHITTTGKANNTFKNRQKFSFHACECENLQRLVKESFALDTLGKQKGPCKLVNKEDVRSLTILQSTLRRANNRYEVGLLWKYDNLSLPNSYNMAVKRLDCLERKAAKDLVLLENINNQVSNLVQKGYARKLSKEEPESGLIWYLPTFIVQNPNKPTKVRLVWDAASEVDGISLNYMLMKGPDQLTDLVHILFRFRQGSIAICGDIREMFHQVQVRLEDQHAQRFLWRDGNRNKDPDIYVMQVLTFGATCSPSIAQYVKNTNASQFINEYPRAVKAIVDHHYVDDLLDSVDNSEEMIRLVKEIIFIHEKAGFEMRNWKSNSMEVLKSLEEKNNLPKDMGKLGENEQRYLNDDKVLGLWWSPSTDVFRFSLKYVKIEKAVLLGETKPTKRQLLRAVMSIFYPLGFLSFFTIYAKIILQDVWRAGIQWDDTLPEELFRRWRRWVLLLPSVQDLQIPRHYFKGLPLTACDDVQLHVFVDASEDAYAAVAYFRFKYGDNINCTLIASKAKVAPIQPMSIPRLELQAALLGARVSQNIMDHHEVKIKRRYLWTDSRTVLSWLKDNPRSFKQFVMLRIGEILELTQISEWRWVPTEHNVADEATKWKKDPKFNLQIRWLNGPYFLIKGKDHWPQMTKIESTGDVRELRLMMHVEAEVPFIDTSRCSKWERLIKTMAYVKRFVENVKGKYHYCKPPTHKGLLTHEEIIAAAEALYRFAQRESYQKEI